MKNDKGVEIGDLVMWVDTGRNLVYGKVVNFDYQGTPIAKEIKEQIKYERTEDGSYVRMNLGANKYAAAHVISSEYFVIRKANYSADTVEEEHILQRAVRQYLELEGLK